MNWLPPTEFSPEFVEGMKNRMAVSYAKYGPVAAGFPAKVDAIQCLRERLDKYVETGNSEWLMDVSNFAMIEHMHPAHPKAHFRSTDSDESPGRFVRDDAASRDEHNANLSGEPWKEMQGFARLIEGASS